MPKQYIVFKTTGNKVFYETGDGWTQDRGRAVRFSLKGAADTYMRRYVQQKGDSHYGVVDAEVNTQVLRTLSESQTKKNPTRRKKNCIGCKKTTRRKNPRKKKPSGDHVVFKYGQNGVSYLSVNSQWVGKANRGKFITNSLPFAKRAAKQFANLYKRDKIGVASVETTSKDIISRCSPGKK